MHGGCCGKNANLAPLNVVTGVDGPAIVSAHDDNIKYDDNNDDTIEVANINQGGAPQCQPLSRLTTPTMPLAPTTTLTPTAMPTMAMMTTTAEMMMMLKL
jgi:hypothetical protein